MSNYKASQYVPSFLKSAHQGQKSISLTFSDVSGSNFQNQDSFAYNPEGTALKSTQQLNVDWSKFENHTFFMSAEAKVNLSFEQIINDFLSFGLITENFADASGLNEGNNDPGMSFVVI